MKNKKTRATRRSGMRHAFTLVELAASVVIMGLMTTMIIKAQKTGRQTNCYAVTQAQISSIRNAVDHFARVNNRYPTPAGRSLGVANPSYGHEASGGTIDGYANGSSPILFGALPFQALGLPSSFAVDCWGDQFTYVVTASLTTTASNAPATPPQGFMNGLAIGSLTIKGNASSVLLNNAAYAVISHGETGAQGNGGVPKNNLGSHGWCSSNSPLDHENCNITDATLVSATFNNGANAGANFFDDLITFSAKLTSNCNATSIPVTWTANGNGCDGTVSGPLANGSSQVVTDSVGPATGAATYSCVNGVVTPSDAPVPTCTKSCPTQTLNWGSGCLASFSTIGSGQSSPPTTNTDPHHTGTATGSCAADGTWSLGSTSCAPIPPCPTQTLSWGGHCSGTFATALNGDSSSGTDNVIGYAGTATAVCNPAGTTWETPTGSCVEVDCPAQSLAWGGGCSTTFPILQAGQSMSQGNSAAGYRGSASASCNADGTWAAASGSCMLIPPPCPNQSLSWGAGCSATFPSTGDGQSSPTVNNTNPGWTGSAVATCPANTGVNWSGVAGSCNQIMCATQSLNWGGGCAATFGSIAAGTSSGSTNNASPTYTGTATAACDINGNWQTPSGACTMNTCPAQTLSWGGGCSASFATINPGQTSPSTSNSAGGYTGASTASCGNDGHWSTPAGNCLQLASGAQCCNSGDSSTMGAHMSADCSNAASVTLPYANCQADASTWYGVCPDPQCNRACSSASLSWGGHCSATFSSTASGTSANASNTSGGWAGSANASCNNGSWGGASGNCDPAGCAAMTLNWSGAGGTCSAAFPPTASGQSTSASNTNANLSGTGNATCSGGSWSVSGSCNAVTCGATTLTWSGSDGTCSGSFPTTASGQSGSATNTNGGLTGTGTASCSNGSWNGASGSCTAIASPVGTCPSWSGTSQNTGEREDWAFICATGTMGDNTSTFQGGTTTYYEWSCTVAGQTERTDPCNVTFTYTGTPISGGGSCGTAGSGCADGSGSPNTCYSGSATNQSSHSGGNAYGSSTWYVWTCGSTQCGFCTGTHDGNGGDQCANPEDQVYTTSGTSTPPSGSACCSTTTLSWGSGCSGSFAGVSSGSSSSANNTASGLTGNASATCNSGSWSTPSGSCTAVSTPTCSYAGQGVSLSSCKTGTYTQMIHSSGQTCSVAGQSDSTRDWYACAHSGSSWSMMHLTCMCSGGGTATIGVCGSDNGSTSGATPTNLCQNGTATPLTHATPSTWDWSCLGSGGGSDATCSSAYTTVGDGSYWTSVWTGQDSCAAGTQITCPNTTPCNNGDTCESREWDGQSCIVNDYQCINNSPPPVSCPVKTLTWGPHNECSASFAGIGAGQTSPSTPNTATYQHWDRLSTTEKYQGSATATCSSSGTWGTATGSCQEYCGDNPQCGEAQGSFNGSQSVYCQPSTCTGQNVSQDMDCGQGPSPQSWYNYQCGTYTPPSPTYYCGFSGQTIQNWSGSGACVSGSTMSGSVFATDNYFGWTCTGPAGSVSCMSTRWCGCSNYPDQSTPLDCIPGNMDGHSGYDPNDHSTGSQSC